jgi:hypothetical protein
VPAGPCIPRPAADLQSPGAESALGEVDADGAEPQRPAEVEAHLSSPCRGPGGSPASQHACDAPGMPVRSAARLLGKPLQHLADHLGQGTENGVDGVEPAAVLLEFAVDRVEPGAVVLECGAMLLERAVD